MNNLNTEHLRLEQPADQKFTYEPPSDYLEPLKRFIAENGSTEYIAIIVPAKLTQTALKQLKNVAFNRPKTRNVYPVDGSKELRKVVLNSTEENVFENEAIQTFILEHPEAVDSIKPTKHKIESRYEDYTVEQILRMILPTDIDEIPCAFEVAGHLAHVNLRDDCLPYRKIVGQVIMDKNQPRLKTIVNKLGSIENEFRTFPMEVIAGEDNMIVELKEEGCRFRLDFSKVYWNSRLQFEHRRLVELIANESNLTKFKKEQKGKNSNTEYQSNIAVADIMCGVGPFSVPLSSQYGIKVYANDLNPKSFEYLLENKNLNKCGDLLEPYNLDGRVFVKTLEQNDVIYHHAIMNLPAIAIEFLDIFRGWKAPKCCPDHLPMIHVHCFVKFLTIEDMEETALKRCEVALGCSLDREVDKVKIHVVRDVAPNKNMLCVSFRLPKQVKSLPRISLDIIDDFESNKKKARLDS